jgi:AmiR/NasT family two-component response regulator
MLATHAAAALIAADRQTQFDSALAGRDVLGQAKGVLMERFKIDAV